MAAAKHRPPEVQALLADNEARPFGAPVPEPEPEPEPER